MRNHFCVRSGLYKNKRRIFSWNCLKVLHVFLLTIVLSPFKGMCSKGDMLSGNNASSVSSGGRELATDQPIPLTVKKGTESKIRSSKTPVIANISLNSEEERVKETISSPSITESTISNPIDNALLPEPDYESPHYTSSMPETGSYPLLESNELFEAEEQGDIAAPPADNEIDNLSYEDEITSESSQVGVKNQDGMESDIDSAAATSELKSMLSTSTPSTKTKSKGTSVPPQPPRPPRSKYPLLKKVPTRLIAAAASNKVKPPKKVAYKVTTRSTTKRPIKLTTTKIRRPGTPFPHSRDPNHPHGVVVFDKRKKRPRPGHRRHTTKATTTTASTTTSTTTTTTAPFPLEADYYDYDWGTGESGESNENLGSNSTDSSTNSTSSNRKPSIPLSKLAMAMIASSDIFDNGTGSDDDMFYPKTPVNLLHILQSYTKQLQLANAESTVKRPAVQIQTTPFMVQLSQLNFGTRVAISVYYSLIAIIPLVYLAFGGLGRLGFFNAFGGRGFGRRRRKRRSYGGNQYYFGGNDGYQTTIIQRSNLHDRNDDEYTWILGRISEIILEFSLMADEMEK